MKRGVVGIEGFSAVLFVVEEQIIRPSKFVGGASLNVISSSGDSIQGRDCYYESHMHFLISLIC